MQAIETVYNGYRFRSRLEARWAVFFDALGVKYEYEPEGFVKNNVMYLPDFRVKCWGYRGFIDEKNGPEYLYIEVKGNMTKEDALKLHTFSATSMSDNQYNDYMSGKRELGELDFLPILIVDRIPDEEDGYLPDERDLGYDLYSFNYRTVDGDYFGAYPAADSYGRFYLMGADSNYIPSKEDCWRVEDAYEKARQARFEHGEKPLIRG